MSIPLRAVARVCRAAMVLVLLSHAPPLTRAFAAAAQGPSPSGAALLLEQGSRVARGQDARSARAAVALWDRAAASARREGNAAVLADALRLGGETLAGLSAFDSASERLSEALEVSRPSGAAAQARVLVALARLDLQTGRTDSARVRAGRALALLGDSAAGPDGRVAHAGARMVLGEVLRLAGQADSAFAEVRGALSVAAPGSADEAEAMRLMGDVFRLRSRPDSALAWYGRALAAQQGMGDVRGAAWTLRGAGLTQWRAGRGDSALVAAQRAMELFARVGDRRGEAVALADVARYRLGAGAADTALAGTRRALLTLGALGDRWGEAVAAADLGSALLDRGREDSASVYLTRALVGFRTARDVANQAWVLSLEGNLHRDEARYDSAAAYYGAAVLIRRRLGARSAEGWLLDDLGRAQALVGRPDSARAAYERALALGRETGDPQLEGAVKVSLGDLEQRAAHGAAARRWYAAADSAYGAAADSAGEARALARLGLALSLGGVDDSARLVLGRAATLAALTGSAAEEADATFALADLDGGSGHLAAAAAGYRRGLAIARRAGDRAREGIALARIADHLTRSWELDSARVYVAASEAALREAHEPQREADLLDGTAGDLATRLGRPDLAADAYRRALDLYRRGGNKVGEPRALLHLGEVFRRTTPDSARGYLTQALAAFRSAGDPEDEGWTLVSLGRVLTPTAPDSALVLLRAAAAAGRARGLPLLSLHAAYVAGLLHLARGRPDSASARLREALAFAGALHDTGLRAEMLERLADVERSRSGPAAARRATALYDSAAWALSHVSGALGADEDRVSFDETDAQLWPGWTLAWLARARGPLAGRARLAALAVGERGRAQALLRLMRRTGAGGVAPRPAADLAAEGRALVARVRAGGAAVVIYQPAGDTLLRWLLPPSGPPVVLPAAVPRDSLAALVRAARAALGADEAEGRGLSARRAAPLEAPAAPAPPYRGALQKLSALLLPDSLVSRLPAGGELVIVPGGVLNVVPFAALPLPGGEYLGARHALRYAPSLAALAEAQARPAVPRDRLAGALVVGNPAMPTITTYTGEEVELDPLPGAAREADEVAERLGARALHGADAAETRVLALLPEAPLVHLATHGFAYGSPARARESFVALAPGGGEDGLLTVAEVLSRAPRLRAELVVLSACQSGLGSLTDAEGTVGLQRAFLARGARSVLVSLWSVSDRATEALMRGFYGHWLHDADRPGKSEALRRAQADVRATPGMESPLYWAAFQLSGAR